MSSGSGLDGLRQALGVDVPDDALVLALTHRSYAYENGNPPTNERLEFLGDSVLSIVVTEWLYRSLPDEPEGQLAKIRSSVVSAVALAEVARSMDIGAYVLVGKGEEQSGGRDKTSILADTFEALLGAMYVHAGMDTTRNFIEGVFVPLMRESSVLGAALDWKTSLQELSSTRGLGIPEYHVTWTGPEHEKQFTAEARIDGATFGVGVGTAKKIAEQRAAEAAYQSLEN